MYSMSLKELRKTRSRVASRCGFSQSKRKVSYLSSQVEEAEVDRAHVERGDLGLELRRRPDALLDLHVGAAAGGDVDRRVGRLLDPRQEAGEGLRRLVGLAGLGVAGVQVQDRGAGLRGGDRLGGDLVGGDRQVGRHGRGMDRPGHGAGDDHLALFGGAAALACGSRQSARLPFACVCVGMDGVPQVRASRRCRPRPATGRRCCAPASESRKATVAATSQGLVIRRSEMFAEVARLHLLVADADLLRAVGDDALHARPLDDAGQDGVDADAGRAELLGEALGQADHAPLRRRVRGAEGVAEAPRGGGHRDDGAAAGGLQHRHGATGAEELAGQADVDAAPPVGRVDLVDAAGRAGDAGVVDERVEPAEGGGGLLEERVDLRLGGDVGADGGDDPGARPRRAPRRRRRRPPRGRRARSACR